MKTLLLSIGDELLIGQVVNTNAAWMAEQLNLSGFSADRIMVIADDAGAILQALREAEDFADLVLVTGGLGPTKDDITKPVICDYFGTHLVFNEEAYHDIEVLFPKRGLRVTEQNRKQAELPESCITIPNSLGTARGMWFEKKNRRGTSTVFVFMPGVPFEMKEMFIKEIIPRMKERFQSSAIVHRTILTQGIGESFLSDILEPWETKLPENISLAYLPQPGIVRLRLTGKGTDEAAVRGQVEKEAEKLEKLIPQYIYGYGDQKLEVIIGELLRNRKMTLSTAESCTGGYIAHLITTIPGSSDYFKGSVVAYFNDIKVKMLGVRPETLAGHGAVSEEVVLEMAAGAQKYFGTGYAIATSGIAGPGGGTPEKPVGTTWIAIAAPDGLVASHFLFGEDRERNIRRTALQALNMLRKVIIDELQSSEVAK